MLASSTNRREGERWEKEIEKGKTKMEKEEGTKKKDDRTFRAWSFQDNVGFRKLPA
jgi:hypothetical protein